MEQNNKEQTEQRDLSQLNSIERFYERFRGVSLKKLDIFIVCCILKSVPHVQNAMKSIYLQVCVLCYKLLLLQIRLAV